MSTVTKNEVEYIVEKSSKKIIEDLSEVISSLAQSMHTELESLKKENKEIKESLNRLTNTIDGFVGRIDRYEAEQLARDNQFNRLVEWARKVSDKTGIPLVDL